MSEEDAIFLVLLIGTMLILFGPVMVMHYVFGVSS